MKGHMNVLTIDVTHELQGFNHETYKICEDKRLAFHEFVNKLYKHVPPKNYETGQRQYFVNNKEIQPNEKRTLETLDLKKLVIRNRIQRGDSMRNTQLGVEIGKIISKCKTKIHPGSLGQDQFLQHDIRGKYQEITNLILTNPQLESSKQDEDIIQQGHYFMKRNIEDQIKEVQIKEDQIKENIQPKQNQANQPVQQNQIKQVLDILSDQLSKGNKRLVTNDNGSVESLQVAAASQGQNIYEVRLDYSEKDFINLLKDGKEDKFIKEFQHKIAQSFKIEEKNINILGLEKGSMIVQFVVNGILMKEQNYEALKNQYKDQLIDFKIKPFFEYIGLTYTNFDHEKNEDWTSEQGRKAIYTRRGQNQLNYKIGDNFIKTGPTDNPLETWNPIGWKAYGLNVKNIYDKEKNQNKWLEEFGEDAWYVVYALTVDNDLDNIEQKLMVQDATNDFKQKTRVFNKIEIAEKYCKITQRGQNEYKMIFQCRVYPKGLFVGKELYNFTKHNKFNEFHVEEIQHLRVERILLGCPSFTDCVGSCQLI